MAITHGRVKQSEIVRHHLPQPSAAPRPPAPLPALCSHVEAAHLVAVLSPRSAGEPVLGEPLCPPRRRHYYALAQKLTTHPAPPPPPPPPLSHASAAHVRPDPYALLAPELLLIRNNLCGLLGSAHPGLHDAARDFLSQPAQKLRPLLVLLFAQATNGVGRGWRAVATAGSQERASELDRPLTQSGLVTDAAPHMRDDRASF
ncbi:hypothetical protein BD626DRAFT_405418, partial [Schizophyllum amplum]